MPPEAALEAWLAPPQLYIVLAITVATFGWLLKPESLGSLSLCEVGWGALLVLTQVAHIALYSELPARLNELTHGVLMALYLMTAFWLFATRWQRAKDHPPNSPPS